MLSMMCTLMSVLTNILTLLVVEGKGCERIRGGNRIKVRAARRQTDKFTRSVQRKSNDIWGDLISQAREGWKYVVASSEYIM